MGHSEKHCGPTNFPSSHHRPTSRKPFSHACGRKRRYEVGTTDPTLFHGAVLPGKHTHTHTHGESTQRKADGAPCSKAPVRFAFFIQLHFLSLSLSDFHNRSLDYLSSCFTHLLGTSLLPSEPGHGGACVLGIAAFP